LTKINGFNYNHHAASRQFKGALPVYDDADNLITDYVVLNDGGLNTMGDGSLGTKELVNAGINVNSSYLSSFYDNSSAYGIRFKKSTSIEWINIGVSNVLAFQDNDIKTFQIPSGNFTFNDTINIQSFITNPEGTYYSIIENYVVPRLILNWKGVATFASQASSQGSITVYAESMPIENGTIITTSISGSGSLSAGYYADFNSWYKIAINGSGKSEIDTSGLLGNWPSGDPATPVRYNEVTFVHTDASYTHGCPLVINGNGTSYTCYFDNVDYVYRVGSNGGSLVNDGFYYDGSTAGNGSPMFVHLVSGAVVAEGNCTDGINIEAV
jgi:hypothetical protein